MNVFYCHLSKINVQVGQKIGEDEMIQNSDNEWARYSRMFRQIRGRLPSRDEFNKSGVGKSWLNAIEILSDGQEADVNTHYADVGRLATKDDWPNQIYSLQAAVKKLQEGGNVSQADVDNLIKEAQEAVEAAKKLKK